jgi:hypothetical protein
MHIAVEVLGMQYITDLIDCVVLEQNASENTSFGNQILRRQMGAREVT